MKEIPLTRGKVALVDDEDYERLSIHKWHACRTNDHRWYARRMTRSDGKRCTVFMHREILGLPAGRIPNTDHANGDGLNNQRRNLRLATYAQNNANGKLPKNNSSSVKGVSWFKRDRKWHARIMVNRKRMHLGLFDTLEAAAEAYRRAAEQYFGDFAFHRRFSNEEG